MSTNGAPDSWDGEDVAQKLANLNVGAPSFVPNVNAPAFVMPSFGAPPPTASAPPPVVSAPAPVAEVEQSAPSSPAKSMTVRKVYFQVCIEFRSVFRFRRHLIKEK